MRHRIGGAAETHLGGNPTMERMDGRPTGNKERDALIRECAKDVYETFFKETKLDYDGVDAQAREYEVRVGIEPAYQYGSLKMLVISKEKVNSYIETGYAFGLWGSGLRVTRKYYGEYKTKAKFTRFVDKWHAKLWE